MLENILVTKGHFHYQGALSQGHLYMVDPSLRNLSSREKETWQDAQGRAVYSSMLIRDEMPGALNKMTEQTYPGQSGQQPEFGDEILEIAKRLQE